MKLLLAGRHGWELYQESSIETTLTFLRDSFLIKNDNFSVRNLNKFARWRVFIRPFRTAANLAVCVSMEYFGEK